MWDIYCRISRDREGAGLGVRRQEKDCREFAEVRGWPVGKVWVDNDLGAYAGKKRPGFEAALARLAARDIDGIIVWHLDRLTRRPVELERVIDVIEKSGGSIATVTGGDYDLTTTDGRAMARVVGAFARKESEDKSRRNRRKHLELAQAGVPVGGTRPFGYDDDKVTVRPDEAAVIRDAARAVLEGDSLRSVCLRWNEQGLAGPRGGRWTQTAIRRILVSPRLVGLRSLGDTVVGPGQWEAILDRDTWERVKATLAERATSPLPFQSRRYLLTGFLRCGKCGSLLIARARSDRRRTYVCTNNPDKGGCGGIRIVAEPLEDYVTKRALSVLELRGKRRPSDPTEPLLAELERLEADQAQAARDYYADRVIGRAEFLAASEAISRRIGEVRGQLARITGEERADLDPVRLRGEWKSLTLERQRSVIAAAVVGITVRPAVRGRNWFDTDRVNIDWR